MTAGTTVGVTCASIQALGMDTMLDTARRAQDLGYRSVWAAETTGPEAFATLAAIAGVAPGVDLGTGVLALQLRTPMLAAMGAATLQSIRPDADVLLGVGISSPVVTSQWHGTDYGERPLARTREYQTLVRECLAGEAVSFDGDFYRCRKFRLGIRLGERRPQLVLGALNAKMLALAGELADGVLLNYLPAHAVPWCVEQVRAGEAAAGRPTGSCTVYAYVHVGVADREAAAEPARRDLFSYAVVDAYARAFSRAGYADAVAEIRERHAARDRDGAVAAVSDAMVDEIDIVGDGAHVAAAVEAYRTAGVDQPIVMPLPWGEDRRRVLADTLAAAAPAS
jgi:probable F420-dependent oxidoreductase